MRIRQSLAAVALVASFVLIALDPLRAYAQSYPTRPVQLITPTPAGSSADAVARLLGEKLSPLLSQPVVVVNKVGASSLIGAAFVADASPDGYTLLLGNPSGLVYNAVLFKSLPYDPVKSFSPITVIAEQPLMVVANSALPVRTLADLVTLAKSKKGEIPYGASSKAVELIIEYFSSVAGVQLRAIPYRGTPDALAALLGGQIEVMFDPVQTIYPQAKSGRVRALAVTSGKRSAIAPEVPTIAEQGYPKFEVSLWYGIAAPAGTPNSIVARLREETLKVLSMPDVKEKFLIQGIQPVSSTPSEMSNRIRLEVDLWKKVAAEKKIEPQ